MERRVYRGPLTVSNSTNNNTARKVAGVRVGKKPRKNIIRKKKKVQQFSAGSRVSSTSSSSESSNSSSETDSETSSSSDNDSSEEDPINEHFNEEEEEDDDDQEEVEDYCKGGYHPVKLGDIYKNGRYRILRKLGWGHFSTVWLSRDLETQELVAIKILKSANHVTESALDELKLLKCTRETKSHPHWDKTVQMLDDFKISGVNGTHICMVFEVLGPNLLKLIKDGGIPLPCVKSIMRQLLASLDYLHRKCQIIHTDLKPENILICLDDGKVSALAAEAEKWLGGRQDMKIPLSAVTAAPGGIETKINRASDSVSLPKETKSLNNASVTVSELADALNRNTLSENPNTEGPGLELGEPSASTPLGSGQGDPQSKLKTLNPPKEKSDSLTILNGNPTEDTNGAETDVRIKIADLGNACWTYHHFTSDIQTRQYRCLEVLLGAKYGISSDIWSAACVAFELATGDYLFEPHSGDNYSRDEDHIAHISELLGKIPKKIALSGKHSSIFFNRKGQLRHIPHLKFWSLPEVLMEKYEWTEEDARGFSDFLLPMLSLDKDTRATAGKSLKHPWLKS